MKKIYLIIVPFWFALFSYLLLEQFYLALLCLALSLIDVLFFIFKKKKEQEKEKKKYLMDEAFLDTLLISPNEMNKTLESFNLDCDYAEVDKDASYQSFKDRREGYYLRALEEAKKKKKEKMFLSKMRILDWKIKKKRENKDTQIEKEKSNGITTLLASFIFIAVIRYALAPYFTYLKGEMYFQLIVMLFLAILWIGVHSLMLLRKENHYEIINFNQWKD